MTSFIHDQQRCSRFLKSVLDLDLKLNFSGTGLELELGIGIYSGSSQEVSNKQINVCLAISIELINFLFFAGLGLRLRLDGLSFLGSKPSFGFAEAGSISGPSTISEKTCSHDTIHARPLIHLPTRGWGREQMSFMLPTRSPLNSWKSRRSDVTHTRPASIADKNSFTWRH